MSVSVRAREYPGKGGSLASSASRSYRDAMKLATWNINSLRARLGHVVEWLDTNRPDLLALQETKVADEEFPVGEIKATGYRVLFSGEKAYNGVAILSRKPAPADIALSLPGVDNPQRRVLAATFGKLRLINLYVPNGGSVGSETYEYKLRWLEMLCDYISAQLVEYPLLAVVGDLNIAPEERDVWEPMLWENRVLFSEPERQAFRQLLDTGLVDAFRLFQQKPGSFSWWDYRFGAFGKNQGLRIDHILVSSALAGHCRRCRVDTKPRGWERPSDHAPVLAEFDL